MSGTRHARAQRDRLTPELRAAARSQAQRNRDRRDDVAFGCKVAGLIVGQVALFMAAMLLSLGGWALAGELGQGIGLALGLIALIVVTLVAAGRTFDTY